MRNVIGSATRFFPVTLLLVLCVLKGMLVCQEPGFDFGVGGAWTPGWSSGSITVYPGSAQCGEFASASIAGFRVDGTMIDRELFGARSGLVVSLGYRSLTWDATTPAVDPLAVRANTPGEVYRIGREYHFTLAESIMEGTALWRGGLPGSLGLNAGMGLGYRMKGTFSRTEKIIDGSGYRYDSGLVERPLAGIEPLALERFRFSVQVGIDYDLRLKGGALLPFVRVAYDPFGPEDQRRLSSVDASVGLAYLFAGTDRLTPPPPPPAPARTDTLRADTSLSSARPTQTHLTASVEVYGLDQESNRLPAATVTVYETITRLETEIPHRLPLQQGAFMTAGIDTRTEAARFVADSLAGSGSIDLERHALALLADGLRRTDSARLKIVGEYRRQSSQASARARAESIKKYLVDIWSIAPERIETEAVQGKGGSDNVVVVLRPESMQRRIVLERHERHVVPPLLAVDKNYSSDAGIKRWSIELFHGERRVGQFTSDSGGSGDSALSWDISPGDATRRSSALVAELTVEDSAGTTATTRAPAPLIIDRPCRVVLRTSDENGAPEGVIASLFPFADGSSHVESQNEQAIERLLDNVGQIRSLKILLDSERGMGRRLTNERGGAVQRTVLASLRRRGMRHVRVELKEVDRNINPIGEDLPEGARGSLEILLDGRRTP